MLRVTSQQKIIRIKEEEIEKRETELKDLKN